MSNPKKGQGKTHQWLVDHLDYPHDEWCLIWPFSLTRGYGALGYLGEKHYAHRFMCELKHGPAPSDLHEAAHDCGNNGCVNPLHLNWKTPTENMLDRRVHGTHVRHRDGNMGRITPEQAAEIRSLKGLKRLWEIAEQFGISESAVSNIWVGRTHARPPKLPPRWTVQEDAALRDNIGRGLKHKAVAEIVGRPVRAVSSRAKRLGIGSPRYTKRAVAPADQTFSEGGR